MQVEIDQTVHQQAAARSPSAKSQSIRKGIAFRLKKSQGTDDEQNEKPSAANAADDACFRERLQVVVVGVVYDLSVVETLVGRIDLLDGPETSAEDRVIQE